MQLINVHTDLVKKLKKGDKQAFRVLFDMYRNDLYKYSLSMVFSEAHAEEIVQDVFLKVWTKRASLNIDLSIRAYLFTITRNKTIKFLKKAANNAKLREEVFYNSQKFATPPDLSLREEEIVFLKEKALRKLSPKRRVIFEMSRAKGMSYEDIAQELGISISTVKNQMSKSLEILRDYLLKQENLPLVFCLFYLGWV